VEDMEFGVQKEGVDGLLEVGGSDNAKGDKVVGNVYDNFTTMI